MRQLKIVIKYLYTLYRIFMLLIYSLLFLLLYAQFVCFHVQICETSWWSACHCRLHPEWPLPSGGDGEAIWHLCSSYRPIWSKWKASRRKLWWTITNQGVKITLVISFLPTLNSYKQENLNWVNVKIDYKNYDFPTSDDNKTKIRRNLKKKIQVLMSRICTVLCHYWR